MGLAAFFVECVDFALGAFVNQGLISVSGSFLPPAALLVRRVDDDTAVHKDSGSDGRAGG